VLGIGSGCWGSGGGFSFLRKVEPSFLAADGDFVLRPELTALYAANPARICNARGLDPPELHRSPLGAQTRAPHYDQAGERPPAPGRRQPSGGENPQTRRAPLVPGRRKITNAPGAASPRTPLPARAVDVSRRLAHRRLGRGFALVEFAGFTPHNAREQGSQPLALFLA
jgi:hypothetical protein